MDYTIAVSNKDIWDFYDKHKNVNFEEMNLILIDILENLFESMNPSLNTSIASQLLDNMKSLQNQVTSVTEMVSKSQTDMNTNFTLKFMEFKKDYIEDVKMILTNNTAERVAPIIKEYNDSLFDKTKNILHDILPKNQEALSKDIMDSFKSFHSVLNHDTNMLIKSNITKETLDVFLHTLEEKFSNTILSSQNIFNTLITSSENRLESRLAELRDISKFNNSSQQDLHTNINDILKRFENPSSKGRISENILFNVILSLFPSAEIQSVGTTKETGDIMLIRKGKSTILFENKCYDKNVGQEEVKKFLRDVEMQNCCGIMLSQHTGIVNKDNFEIEMHKGNVLIYLHKVEYDADKIKNAVDIIDQMNAVMENTGEKNTASMNINKEVLDLINKEYQVFVANKTSHVKTIKDFQQKLLAQADEMKLPNLEQYLTKLYATSSSKNDICEYCNYVAKNQRALVAHYRGCASKKQFSLSTASDNAETTIHVDTRE
jgi:hypothetical protein